MVRHAELVVSYRLSGLRHFCKRIKVADNNGLTATANNPQLFLLTEQSTDGEESCTAQLSQLFP